MVLVQDAVGGWCRDLKLGPPVRPGQSDADKKSRHVTERDREKERIADYKSEYEYRQTSRTATGQQHQHQRQRQRQHKHKHKHSNSRSGMMCFKGWNQALPGRGLRCGCSSCAKHARVVVLLLKQIEQAGWGATTVSCVLPGLVMYDIRSLWSVRLKVEVQRKNARALDQHLVMSVIKVLGSRVVVKMNDAGEELSPRAVSSHSY